MNTSMDNLTAPLSDPRFRRLFAAHSIALMGTGLSTVALALLAYNLAGPDAGTALAIKMIAYVGIAPLAGAFRLGSIRKPFLIALDLIRAGLVACLPFVDSLYQVYALIFLISASAALFTPIFQSLIPDIITDEENYTKALSLSRVAYDLENIISPGLAGAFLLITTFDTLFAVNAFAFLLSAALVLSTNCPKQALSDRPSGIFYNLTFGVRSYLATPALRALLLLCLAAASASAMVLVNTVVYVRDVLGGSETDTALAYATAGAGSMITALLLPRILQRFQLQNIMIVGCIIATSSLLIGLSGPSYTTLFICWFFISMGASLVLTPAARIVRASCRETDSPAFFSAQFALSHACWLIVYPLAGWLGATVGLDWTFITLAGLSFTATIAGTLVWKGQPGEVLLHVHNDMEHEHWHIHDEHHMHDHDKYEQDNFDEFNPDQHIHQHTHQHARVEHAHSFVIDAHHRTWPGTSSRKVS